jgi:hypothetical protein
MRIGKKRMKKMKAMTWVAAVFVAVPLGAQEVERVSGRSVAVYNLAGRVEVVRGGGADVVVRIDRGGADAAALRVETGEIRGRSTLRIIYPNDEIVYPDMGRGSNTSLTVRDDGTFSDDSGGRGEHVSIRGRGAGMEAWADLVIEVPAGRDLGVYLATGEVNASGVDGALTIDTGSGAVTATSISGSLDVDTGSGSIVVQGVVGDVRVDTGSGRVEVSDVRGRQIEIDTGSGGVRGYGLEADIVSVDTGSGSIDLESVSASDVLLDTGSGSIDVELMTDVDRLDADTGSGSITVRAPAGLGATVDIETGSGGIDLDFPIEVRSVRRDHVQGTIGDGRGEIRIDTGSGSIRLIRVRS